MTSRDGVTLIELLVALALLGLMAGMVSMDWQLSPQASRNARRDSVVAARRRAIKTGSPVMILVDSTPTQIMVLPNGLVLGAQRLGVEPLTGRDSGGPP